MAAPNAGSGFIFGPGLTVVVSGGAVATVYGGGIVGTTGVVTNVVDVTQMMMTSFQTKVTTGVASVTVDIQVTNVPESSSGYKQPGGNNPGIPAYRDDSYASTDWVTVSTNTVGTAASTSRMDVVAYVPHRFARARLSSSGVNATVYMYYRTQGWGS